MSVESVENAGLRGILQTPPADCWNLERIHPISELAQSVSWVWMVSWDMKGAVHLQKTLPYPTANFVWEDGELRLFGPTSRVFEKRLVGVGNAVGIKLQPGTVRGLYSGSVSSIVDKSIRMTGMFEEYVAQQSGTLGEISLASLSEVLQRFLADRLADWADPSVERVKEIFSVLTGNPQIVTVAALANLVGCSQRTIQRLFAEYVGVGVKATIKRYRLQEAAEVALSGQQVNWSLLANKLGYYDQSHLIGEFTSTFGASPTHFHDASRIRL